MQEKKAITPRKTPEEEELGSKLAELAGLESELAQKELDLSTLQAEVGAFELHYLQLVGAKLAELDAVKALIAEAFARLHPADQQAKREAREARAQAEETKQAHQDAVAQPSKSACFQPSESLKSLYKEAAKKVHPDLANDEKDREERNRVMAEINEAYRNGDEERIKNLLREWVDSPEAISGEDIGAKLVRTIRKIAQVRRRLSTVKTDMAALIGSEIHRLYTLFKEAKAAGHDLLNEMVAKLEEEIQKEKSKLDQLLAGLRRSST